ncbi:MAG: hypothetical protein KAH48_01830 [Chlorobi bacterium]|nr:hypothetical protein [Chlorobiota bacterium]
MALFLIFVIQIAESKSKTRIHLKNGESISGYIIKPDHPDSLFLDLGGGFTVGYPRTDVEEEVLLIDRFSVGFGVGFTYSFIGLNIEYDLFDHLSPIASIGTFLGYFKLYEFGATAYLTDPDSKFRPRVIWLWGINSVIAGKTYTGYSMGVGFKINFSKPVSMTFDLLNSYSSAAAADYKRLKELDEHVHDPQFPLSFSIGVQARFSLSKLYY